MFNVFAVLMGLSALNSMADVLERKSVAASTARLARELDREGLKWGECTVEMTVYGPCLVGPDHEGILEGVRRHARLAWIAPPGRRLSDLLPAPRPPVEQLEAA